MGSSSSSKPFANSICARGDESAVCRSNPAYCRAPPASTIASHAVPSSAQLVHTLSYPGPPASPDE